MSDTLRDVPSTEAGRALLADWSIANNYKPSRAPAVIAIEVEARGDAPTPEPRVAERHCLTCGKAHVLQDGPTPKSAVSWADPVDGHIYRLESWEAVAHRLAATESPDTRALDVEGLGDAVYHVTGRRLFAMGITTEEWSAISTEYERLAALPPETGR